MMTDAIRQFVSELKQWLQSNKENYLEHDSWGDTETGFHSEDTFDFDAMLKEIDKFSEEFKKDQP